MSSYDRRMKKVKKFYNKPIGEECFNLDLAFVDFMVPRLELFKKDASKVIDYDFIIIDEILKGFKLYQKKFDWELEDMEKNMEIVRKSMDIFAEHLYEFWW